jgi:heterodisulfide reductase subunit B
VVAAALPLYNLGLLAEAGAGEVVVPCAACLARMKHALHEVRTSPSTAAKVEQALGAKPATGVRPIHPLEIVAGLAAKPEFPGLVVRDLSGLKVACYYGCLLTRPPEVMGFPDDPEYPTMMDRLLEACGARAVGWSSKTDCCGASFSLTLSEIVVELTGRVLANAKECGANCVAVACSLCHANLDTRQAEIAAQRGQALDLPVFYFTLGVAPRALGLHKHLVSPLPLLEGLGMLSGAGVVAA